jgi:phage terminase small subunit
VAITMDRPPQESCAVVTATQGPQHPSPTTGLEGGEDLQAQPINYGVESRHFKRYGYEIVSFIREYTKDLSMRRAADAAWPNKFTKTQLAEAALHDPEICLLIDRALEAKRRAFLVEEGTLIRTLAHRAFARMGDYITVQKDGTAYVDLSECTEDQLAAVSEIQTEELTEGRGDDSKEIRKVKLKLHNPDKPAELLMRKLGMLREDQTTVNVMVGIADRLADAKKQLEEEVTCAVTREER